MRDVGKHFTVNAMLAKESVKRRIESEDGITYTEFSYSLLQAYDFLELYDRFGCTLQMGGSDQWGNITAGMDLIRRVRGGKAHGLVLPLITTSSGTKFGKTEAGTIWLDPERTTPYEFYQFWLNADDRDAVRYLKFFTFLDARRIAELEAAGAREPEKRHAQRALAREVTRWCTATRRCARQKPLRRSLFSGASVSMSLKQIAGGVRERPVADEFRWPRAGPWSTCWRRSGVTKSKSEATRLIRGGGIYVNDRRITDEKERLTVEQAIEGKLFVVRKGKTDNFLVRIR